MFLGPYVAKLSSKVATSISAKLAAAQTKTITALIKNAGKLKRTATVLKNLATRPYINSTLTIQNIMKSSKPVADAYLKNGLKWVVRGSYNGSYGVWELVIDVSTNTIVHFLFRKG